MLIVTHQLEFARAVADRIVFIDEGVIVEEAKPEEAGSFIYKLRDELSQALDRVDLSDIPLYYTEDEQEMTTKEQIDQIKSFIEYKGFTYDSKLIENFYLSLKSKPFVILAGTSGTGKTELGRYIAHELNLPFFYISFVSTIDSYMGSTAKNIHKVFEFCKSIPCVLMLDEIDCVARRRDSTGSRGADGELERTTITIMQELDNLPNHVTLIAATNRMDMVDEALLRRFSIKQEIEDMKIEDRKRMIKQFLKATNTEKYVTESQINGLANAYSNPGQIMPELTKSIGKGIFEEKKDEILLKEENNTDEKTNIFEVTYSWKQNISAENEEDAIAIARHESMYSARHGNYIAKRAEFIGPAEGDKRRER